MTDPITPICNAAMRLFADLAATAAPGSDFARGRAVLGDRWIEVAVQALRGAIKALLTEDGPEVLADLAACGELAARERLLGVAHAALATVAAHG